MVSKKNMSQTERQASEGRKAKRKVAEMKSNSKKAGVLLEKFAKKMKAQGR